MLTCKIQRFLRKEAGKRMAAGAAGIALFTGLCAGCTYPAGSVESEQLLRDTVKKVNDAENFAFQGESSVTIEDISLTKDIEFQGYVQGRGKAVITKKNESAAEEQTLSSASKLNPLVQLNRLADVQRSVTVNQELSDNVTLVLDIESEPNEMAAFLKEQWGEAAAEAELEQMLGRVTEKYGLSSEQQERWKAIAAERIEQARGKYIAMLDSVNTDTHYRLYIDKGTELPSQLEASTTLQYKNEEAEREETSRTIYRFYNYSEDQLIDRESIENP
ncbi:hypothetical protein [Paenibacillus turpanensis]|uniref:hypothetical protein n=1 Tax=Paenibacillus turpanensis TaxID=2689078 RepID=UPI00140C023F|nr:hypothetical protein [Paenibacillus turpanensis]